MFCELQAKRLLSQKKDFYGDTVEKGQKPGKETMNENQIINQIFDGRTEAQMLTEINTQGISHNLTQLLVFVVKAMYRIAFAALLN